jgi:hypothetical protein
MHANLIIRVWNHSLKKAAILSSRLPLLGAHPNGAIHQGEVRQHQAKPRFSYPIIHEEHDSGLPEIA